jgi:hypothetical protein
MQMDSTSYLGPDARGLGFLNGVLLHAQNFGKPSHLQGQLDLASTSGGSNLSQSSRWPADKPHNEG